MPDCGGASDIAGHARQLDVANESLSFLIGHLFRPGVECKRRDGRHCPHDGCGKVSAILRFITRNVVAEDRLMAETDYPDAVVHRRAHVDLLAALRDLFDRRLCGDEDDEMIRASVSAWEADHARRYDKPLSAWLAATSVVTMQEAEAAA